MKGSDMVRTVMNPQGGVPGFKGQVPHSGVQLIAAPGDMSKEEELRYLHLYVKMPHFKYLQVVT